MQNIKLIEYNGKQNEAINLVKGFWLAHNDYVQNDDEAIEDIINWTSAGHLFYYIMKDEETIGFIHLASRGAEIDWVEDIFIKPDFQGYGYGSMALKLIEEKVKKYSESIYLEVAARNIKAMKLYYKNGYNCLNTVTLRKDFNPEKFKVLEKEELLGYDLEIKEYIK